MSLNFTFLKRSLWKILIFKSLFNKIMCQFSKSSSFRGREVIEENKKIEEV